MVTSYTYLYHYFCYARNVFRIFQTDQRWAISRRNHDPCHNCGCQPNSTQMQCNLSCLTVFNVSFLQVKSRAVITRILLLPNPGFLQCRQLLWTTVQSLQRARRIQVRNVVLWLAKYPHLLVLIDFYLVIGSTGPSRSMKPAFMEARWRFAIKSWILNSRAKFWS